MEDKYIEKMNLSLSQQERSDFMFYLYKAVIDNGIEDIAQSSGLTSQGLRKKLSPETNPKIEDLFSILNSLGLSFRVQLKKIQEEAQLEAELVAFNIKIKEQMRRIENGDFPMSYQEWKSLLEDKE